MRAVETQIEPTQYITQHEVSSSVGWMKHKLYNRLYTCERIRYNHRTMYLSRSLRRCFYFYFVVLIVQSDTESDTDCTNDVDDHVDQVAMDDLLPYGHREKRRRKSGSHCTHHTTRHLCEAIDRSNQVFGCRFSNNNLD